MPKLENSVQFLGYYGGDLEHACSAWTSTSRDLTEEKRNRIPKLLKMLAENGHHTPFEKSSIHFLVNTDIASHIHLLKHRVATSINGESGRYKELQEDKYYIPEDWANIKAKDHTFYAKPLDSLRSDIQCYDDWMSILAWYTEYGNRLYHSCIKDLEPTLGRKRAKESARFFKTYNSQIQVDIMFNFRSFAHFLNLRNSPDAQLEIRQIANTMLYLVENIEGNPFQHTLEAFNFKSDPNNLCKVQ